MFLKLLKNEYIKIFKRSKTWIVFGLFIIFVAISVAGTWIHDRDMRKWTSPEYQIQQAEEQLVNVKQDIERAEKEGDAKWIESAKTWEESLLEQKAENEKILKEGVSPDAWKERLDESIKSTEETIKYYEEEGLNDFNRRWHLESKQQLEDLKYLKDNNIEPLEGWEYQAFNFLITLNEFFGLGVLVAGIAVFMSDIVSGECTPATLKFLLVQPVKRGKVLLSKFIVATTTVLVMIIVPQLLGMAAVNITSDIDASSYPVRIEQQYEKTFDKEQNATVMKEVHGTSTMVTNTEATTRALGLQILFIVATCSVIFMLSVLFKSSMISMAVAVITTIFVTIGTASITSIANISQYLFTTYADSFSLITSRLPVVYQNAALTATNGVICMVITAVIAYVISHIVFVKKDILI